MVASRVLSQDSKQNSCQEPQGSLRARGAEPLGQRAKHAAAQEQGEAGHSGDFDVIGRAGAHLRQRGLREAGGGWAYALSIVTPTA